MFVAYYIFILLTNPLPLSDGGKEGKDMIKTHIKVEVRTKTKVKVRIKTTKKRG